MGILREPKMATKNAPVRSNYCDSCNVDIHLTPVEAAQVETLQVVRCVDPVACRMRAQKLGTWAMV